MAADLSIIVIGGLNTDIVALGAKKLLQAGEYTLADKLYIGPGGKSTNIARMIATLSKKKSVAMIGKTSKDPYGLWKFPVKSLQKSGVNIDYVTVTSFKETGQFPSVALVPVDTKGKNQIYILPGIANTFLPQDIANADALFKSAAANHGMLVLTLELPSQTALAALKKAHVLGLRVLFDPGGIVEGKDYKELFKQKIFLLKPNEHEAKTLTGVIVKDFKSAKVAAEKLLRLGIENVFITHGAHGGYLFSATLEHHIPIPKITIGGTKDETGCGDQTMAAFAVAISGGTDMLEAARTALLAGTLQFYKSGIQPITKGELATHVDNTA